MTRVHVGSLLATGLLTEVRSAHLDGRPCVLKLPRADAGGAGAVRIEDEARVLSRVRGAHLVEAHGRVQWQGRRGLVLAHAGASLQALSSRVDDFSELAIAAIGAQLAAALETCRTATTEDGDPLDLVHRDIAPQNVFVDAEGRVRLADFGNAWFRDRRAQTQVGRVFGTEGFMAPEHRAGALPTPRVDVYAVGCVLAWLRDPRRAAVEVEASWRGPVADWVRWARRAAADERPAGGDELQQACLQVLAGRAPQTVLRTLAGPAPQLEAASTSVALEALTDPRDAGAAAAPALDMFMGAAPPVGPRTRVAAPTPDGPMPEGPADPTRVDGPDAAPTRVEDGPELSAVPTRIQPSTLEAPVGLASPTPEPEARAPQTGDELYGFRLEGVLGEGQWGRVYAARHAILGHEVAVKVLHASMAAKAPAVQRFFREAQTLSRVEHPNVVRVSTCGHSPGGTPFLVMERLAGPSMKEALRTQVPLPPHEVAPLLREIALGLVAAHEAGLVHRDLKPANILMTNSPVPPRLKVVDFGVAQFSHAEDPLTRTNELLGSPAYMAPEQIRRSRDVDPRADLYSLGVTAFWLLTGRRPFEGTSRYKVLLEHLEAPVPPVVPSGELDGLVQALLQKDPEARPSSAAEVVRMLDELAGPVGATVLVSPFEPAPPRWRLPVAALGVAATIGLGAWWATRPAPSAPPPPREVEVVAAPPKPSATAAPRAAEAPATPSPAEAPPPAEPRPKPSPGRGPRPVAPVRPRPARALARRYGVPVRDLRELASGPLADYARAETSAALAASEAEIAKAVEDGARLRAQVQTRVREAKADLRRAAATLPAEVLAEVESSLLDIQERAVRADAPSQHRLLLMELARLERRLRARASD